MQQAHNLFNTGSNPVRPTNYGVYIYMAGQTIEKLPHKCSNTHTSSDGLQTFYNDDGTYTGYCYACSTYVPDPYGDEKPEPPRIKTQQEIDDELQDIGYCEYVPMEIRSITPDSFKFYGVRLGYNQYDGVTPDKIFFPYTKTTDAGTVLVGYKIRLLNEKIFWSVGETKDADMFGWARAKKIGGTLFITEGELDAISLRQILKMMQKGTAYENQEYAVVSINNGVDSAEKSISKHLNEINKIFQKVVLCFDCDGPGKKAAKDIQNRILPESLIAQLPSKDANAALRNGQLKATRDAVIFSASKRLGASLLSIDDLIDEALEDVIVGKDYPWQGLTDLTYGQRKGELISIGAGVGIGKSLLAHEITAYNHLNHGWKTLMVMMEESPAETIRNVCGKIDSIPYHVPGTVFDKEQLRSTAHNISGHVVLWNPDETTDPETTWAAIKAAIRQHGDSIDCVIIDNMTTLSEGLNTSEKNEFIGVVGKEFVELAMKFDFEAILFSHLNSPDKSARAHENGGKVQENQFTGSRALMRYSHMMIGFERNKAALDPNCSLIRVLKNRKYGKTGYTKTYYQPQTGRLFQKNWDDSQYADAKIGRLTKGAGDE